MAEVLLTHSYHLHYDAKQVRKMQPYPPLGTLYAAAVLQSRGISVAVFDTMLQDPANLFPGSLAQHRPEIVVIYEDDFNFLSKMCLTRMRQVALEMITASIEAGARVVVHGSDATDQALVYLLAGASYVLSGESELRLAELVSAMLLGRAPRDHAGLAYLNSGGDMVYEPPVPAAAEWMKMPAPARELIDFEPYRKAWMVSQGYWSLNLVSSRGCPYRCNWCAKPISGDRFHVRPAPVVARELCDLKTRYGADHAWFSDDVFALDRHWVEEFAREVEILGTRVPFKIQSRADLMTETTVDCLRRAGCSEVWMGVESGSQKILDAMEKNLKVEIVPKVRERLARAGIRACYFLQFGYPGEGWTEIQQTIDLVRRTRPDDIGVSVSYPLPNTRFYERVRHQLGTKRNWHDSDDLCATFTAAYQNGFYLALRDALHYEVNGWRGGAQGLSGASEQLWRRVAELEPISRNAQPTDLQSHVQSTPGFSGLIPAQSLSAIAGEV